MVDSAALKVKRAAKHVSDLNELFRKQRPFSYVLQENTKTGKCTTLPKQNEAVVDAASVIIGDAVFNMRSALDHAYWEIVSPFVPPDQQNIIQFPFSRKREGLGEAIKKRKADKVSLRFAEALNLLRPYHEPGGNELLCLIDHFCTIDKHRLLVPTSDYTTLTVEMIRKVAPEIPFEPGVRISFSGNQGGDYSWSTEPLSEDMLRENNIPEIIEKKLNVPVEIVFHVGTPTQMRPVIHTLNELVDETVNVIGVLRASV